VVALVDDDKVEEVGRVLAEVGRGLAACVSAVIGVWKMVKKRLQFLGTLPFLAMSAGLMRTMASSGKALKAL
jgi:hypothetical protein